VIVLEKHADFLRDFRGDTLHPSTLQVMHELGLLDALMRLPHQEVRTLVAEIGETRVTVADFSHLPVRLPAIVLMPQWDFLNFLAEQGGRYAAFDCRMEAEATELIERDGRVAGVRARTPGGTLEVAADLVVCADGRHSTLRGKAGLAVEALGAPIDVFWFRLSRRPEDTEETGGRFDTGRIFVRIYRGDYWQCAYVIPKGTGDAVRRRGIEAFRASVAACVPFAPERVGEIRSWDDVKLLTVTVDRLRRWHRPGLICIGDAAHAMSPVGGVGINLAIQDAVAAANILAGPLRAGRIADDDLARVQARREFPTRVTQRAQVIVQDRILSRVLGGTGPVRPPLVARLLGRFPWLRRLPARLVGMGVRPEHVRTPEAEVAL
jgi:2-polyprenyl-6-methoxyphenol hydroxylase-like FAD-dependent oxidoreductase